MRGFLGIVSIVFGFALCSVQAAQEALGQPLNSQKLAHKTSSQRIVNTKVQDRYTPEMLSERKIRKYRRPIVFSPVKKEKLKIFKKRKAFLVGTD